MALTDQEVQAAWTQLTTQTDLSTLEEGAIAAISAAPAERQAQAQSFLTLEKSLWEFGQTATGADLQRAQAQRVQALAAVYVIARGADIQQIAALPPPPEPAQPLPPQTLVNNMVSAMTKALTLLPGEIAAQVQELLTPTSIAIMTGVFAAWAVSHAVGVGAVADVLLAALGVAYLGLDAIRAAKLLYGFLNHCMPPAPPGAIDDAAREFSQLVTLVGIDIVSMILLGKAFKKARQKLEKKPGGAAPERGKAEDRAPAERTPGEKTPGERAPGERAPGERAPEAKVNDKVGGSPLDPIRGAAIPGAAKTPWPLVVAGGVLLAAGALTLVLHGSSSPPRRRLRDEDEDT